MFASWSSSKKRDRPVKSSTEDFAVTIGEPTYGKHVKKSPHTSAIISTWGIHDAAEQSRQKVSEEFCTPETATDFESSTTESLSAGGKRTKVVPKPEVDLPIIYHERVMPSKLFDDSDDTFMGAHTERTPGKKPHQNQRAQFASPAPQKAPFLKDLYITPPPLAGGAFSVPAAGTPTRLYSPPPSNTLRSPIGTHPSSIASTKKHVPRTSQKPKKEETSTYQNLSIQIPTTTSAPSLEHFFYFFVAKYS